MCWKVADDASAPKRASFYLFGSLCSWILAMSCFLRELMINSFFLYSLCALCGLCPWLWVRAQQKPNESIDYRREEYSCMSMIFIPLSLFAHILSMILFKQIFAIFFVIVDMKWFSKLFAVYTNNNSIKCNHNNNNNNSKLHEMHFCSVSKGVGPFKFPATATTTKNMVKWYTLCAWYAVSILIQFKIKITG